MSSGHLCHIKYCIHEINMLLFTTPNKEYVTDLDDTDDISLVLFHGTP